MNIEILSEPIRVKRAVLGFSGWPDAGKTIEYITTELNKVLNCKQAATWDMDGFWHTEPSSRPNVLIEHGQIQKLEWPTYRFFVLGSVSLEPALLEPVLLGTGPEPTCHWRVFAQELLQRLKGWGCEEIILLGSVYDQIFHDEVLISSVVQDAHSFNLLRELGCQQIEYSGPSAIHSAIMEVARSQDVRSLCLWAHLPFYVNGPNELIIAHCLRILGKLLGVEFETDHLTQRWQEREQEIQNMLEHNQELRNAVETIKKEKHLRGNQNDSSKVVRLDEFLKKRHEHE